MNDKISKDEAMKGFRLFDYDGTGLITLDNLRTIANELDIEVTEEKLRDMIELADNNENGGVTAEDFLKIITM